MSTVGILQVDAQFTAAHENKIGPMSVAVFLRYAGGMSKEIIIIITIIIIIIIFAFSGTI